MTDFTKWEAQKKVGKNVRTKVEFSGIPKGTTGIVTRADRRIVAVTWKLKRTQPLVDWFTKDEYERYLEEI